MEHENEAARRNAMEMISGILKQGGGAHAAGGAGLAEVILVMPVDGRRIRLRSNHRIVPEDNMLNELRTLVGSEHAVQLRGRRPVVTQRKRHWKSRAKVGS
jgi:hypothetical protein